MWIQPFIKALVTIQIHVRLRNMKVVRSITGVWRHIRYTKSQPLNTAFARMTKQQNTKMLQLFRTCYCLVKHNMSLRSFACLISLQEYNGLPLGTAYRNINKDAALSFISSIAKVKQQALVDMINSVPFFSILLDGSTDKATMEQEIVYVRVIKGGKPENVYLGLMNVNGTSAADIAKELGVFLTGLGIIDWNARMVALGTDGASVNMGCLGDLGALLNPFTDEEVPRNSTETISVLESTRPPTVTSYRYLDVFAACNACQHAVALSLASCFFNKDQ